uniref:Peptidase C13 family protein n=1 Tax=Callorhinchus milii TaxID=7868 RepID=A0A4W3JYN5_CALMI
MKLTEKDFMDAIKKMAERKQFGKMVIYLTACHSGSMFKSLPNNIKVYAVTSAAPDAVCYGSNFDKKRNVYLSDEFSESWMKHCNSVNLSETTLEAQFRDMKEHTKSSKIQQYGDLTLLQEKLICFQGTSSLPPAARPPAARPPAARPPDSNWCSIC